MVEVVKNDYGWVLDHLAATELSLLSRNSQHTANVRDQFWENYKMRSELFKILMPFVMDSQVHKITVKSTDCEQKPNRKRKRKRKEPLNIGEQLALDYHEKVRPHIIKAHTTLIELTQSKDIFQSSTFEIDNNLAARMASQVYGPGDALIEASAGESPNVIGNIQELDLTNEISCTERNLVNTLCHHKENQTTMVTLQSGRYLIPPNCHFLMSDLDVLLSGYTALGKFDLIVLDPPWENKSVKRKKKYTSLPNERLLDLPLSQLSSLGSLIVVWVTNRNKHIQFVTEELFPKHGITFIVKWFWLKVTCTGQMVCDLDSAHKRPYETLIIGQAKCSDGQNPGCRNILTSERTIVSVPCSLHSKKPPLYEILKGCLPSTHRCLELFARNLQSHWISWGNEVLLHQHVDFFERVT